MASRTLPGIGLKGFWSLGEDNYKDEMDTNLLTLSVAVRGAVLDIVDTLPGAPSDGEIYALGPLASANPNDIAVRDNGAWVYLTSYPGWLIFNLSDQAFYRFSSTEGWVPFNTALPEPSLEESGHAVVVDEDGTGYTLAPMTGGGGGGSVLESAKKFRIYTTTAGSGGGSAWGTISFSDVNGFLIPISGMIGASSWESVHQPYMAIDGDPSTYWSYDSATETAVGSYWEIEFDNAVILGYLTVRPGLGQAALAPSGFELRYYSEFESDWVTVGTYTVSWTSDDQQTFDVSQPNIIGGGVEDAPTDGKTYARRDGAWVEVPFTLGWGFESAPDATATLFQYTFVEDVTFADDWTGSAGSAGGSPDATYTMTIYKNGAAAGSVSISTGGAVSFTTDGGSLSFTAGDTLKATGGADASLADVSITLKGSRV